VRIVVTGGSGKAGRAVVRDLLEHGHEVLNVDLVASAESSSPDSPAPFLRADLTDFGQALEALGGGELMAQPEAVVHLAAIPSPVHATPDTVFRTNMTSTHAVFAAAARLGLGRVVWASSETTLGLPFDEEHEPRPESSYALSKVLAEEMARQFSRWSGIPFVGLRSAGDKSWSTYGAERAQTVATGGKCDRRRNGSNRRIRKGSQPRATSRALMVRRGSTVRAGRDLCNVLDWRASGARRSICTGFLPGLG